MKKIISLVAMIGVAAIAMTLFLPRARAAEISLNKSIEAVQAGPPWFDPAWNYRRPVTISNSGATLPYYQVLITLNSTNFDFNQANPDGSDVRFTHSDGTTGLNYWIESWNKTSQWAYIWVRIPSLPAGETTIYLYFNNPQVLSASNGNATFDGFDDDWAQFAEGNINFRGAFIRSASQEAESPFVWNVASGTPTVEAGILSLPDGSGITSNYSYQYTAMGMRANFGSGSGHAWGGFINSASGQRAMIGDLAVDPDDLYLIDYRTGAENVLIPRLGGNNWHNAFHVYETRWQANQSTADVDHGAASAASTPSQVPNSELPVTLFSYAGSVATLKVDWVYVRQYRSPEPTFLVGPEQGLVDLRIEANDAPDPLPEGEELTYQLTLTNTSSIAAPGVLVTGTLPSTVQLVGFDPSQGECTRITDIVCDLGLIQANASASIVIDVIPLEDGLITSTARVNSPGFELDTSNNVAEAVTLVDSEPPVVNWEKPVGNGGLYRTSEGLVTLEASATDNDQVAWVEYLLWDHLWNGGQGRWVSAGIDHSYPYKVLFDSNILVYNDPYQMFVRAADRAGNISNPYDPLQRIYIERQLPVFIPLCFRR